MLVNTLESQTATMQADKGPECDGSAVQSEPMLAPRAAAVELREDFTRLAVALSPKDRSTRDDLVQEMCLAVLLCRDDQTRSFYISAALWRARDYLRWWVRGLERRDVV